MCSSDQGRVRAVDSIEDFVHYYDVLEEKLDQILHDPCCIFNVDEVGVQLADRTINLITGREYLNKNMVQTSIHVTLVISLVHTVGSEGQFVAEKFADVY